ncbi:MAG: flippase-like domain-containing protein [Clostridiales bacterium]|nr:flippase-like domain-containing protein [Clostridiales bacterium]
MKNKSFWIKFIIAAVLIGIIVYTFRGSWGDIWQQVKQTSPVVLAMIGGASVVYHLFEAWITYSLAREYNPRFRYRDAVYCAFFCSFYRLSTLGSGAGIAAVIFLGKKHVGYSEATGLYAIQYILHKVSIALFSGIFFLINWRVMAAHYRNYAPYLVLAYALTVLISIALVLAVIYPKFHRLILWLLRKLNYKNKLDGIARRLEASIGILEQSGTKLLKDWKTLVSCVVRNIAKLFFWYSIPFLILFQSGVMTLRTSLSVTSLSVMTAAVIPTPAGIGSTELIMTGLFGVLVDVDQAMAITLLYRTATFIFPFVVGAGCILGERVVKRFRRLNPR